MSGAPSPLTLELLSWISSRPRTYAETIEVWRSNCPREPVWDNALIGGLVHVVHGRETSTVTLTELGLALLDGRP